MTNTGKSIYQTLLETKSLLQKPEPDGPVLDVDTEKEQEDLVSGIFAS